MSLLEDAKKLVLKDDRSLVNITDESYELAIAYYKGEVSSRALWVVVSKTSKKNPTTNAQQWTSTRIRHGVRAGRIEIFLKEKP